MLYWFKVNSGRVAVLVVGQGVYDLTKWGWFKTFTPAKPVLLPESPSYHVYNYFNKKVVVNKTAIVEKTEQVSGLAANSPLESSLDVGQLFIQFWDSKIFALTESVLFWFKDIFF